MSNLAMLKKQHKEVLELVDQLNELMKSNNLDTTAKNMAYNINKLSGKLKMHLMSEDKFLYPSLITVDDAEIQNTAQTFYNEMKDVSNLFACFVQKYNTATKILQNRNDFQREYKEILKTITARITKENNHLYPLLKD